MYVTIDDEQTPIMNLNKMKRKLMNFMLHTQCVRFYESNFGHGRNNDNEYKFQN
jgi:hypothetical protein